MVFGQSKEHKSMWPSTQQTHKNHGDLVEIQQAEKGMKTFQQAQEKGYKRMPVQ